MALRGEVRLRPRETHVSGSFSAEGPQHGLRHGGQCAPLAWEKQVLYGEPSKPNRIGHPIRHKVQ